MNLLIDYETYGQTAQMTHEIFLEFSKKCKCGLRAKNTYSISNHDIEWADIVLSIRPMNNISAWISKICERYSKLHIVMYDDNLLNHIRTDRYMNIRKEYMKKTISHAQVLLTTNELLTELLKQFNTDIRTAHIDTVVDKSELRIIPPPSDEMKDLRLVYYSNDGTTKYFEDFIPEVIQKLSSSLPDVNLSIDLIGVNSIKSDMGHCKVNFVPHMGYSQFKEYLRNSYFTAGISPVIKDDDFSKYKYFNKFIEYTSAGIVGIYSNCEPYIFEVRDGYNGFLCDADCNQWVDRVLDLYNNPSNRSKLLNNAYETIIHKHSFQSVLEKLVFDIPELVHYDSSKKKVTGIAFQKVLFYLFWIREKLNATVRYFKMGGIKVFFKRTKAYFDTMNQISKERQNEG